MSDRPHFDPDEPVSLFPDKAENVLRRLLGADEEPDEDEEDLPDRIDP